VVCPTSAQQIVFQAYVRAVNEQTERLARLEPELQDQVKSWRLNPVVEGLQALRGVQFTVAVTTVAELGDLTRFDTPRQLMKFLGLIPSEYSSAERRHHGSITKAGNTHARCALVEGAWASRDPTKVSRHLQLRLEKQPKGPCQLIARSHDHETRRDMTAPGRAPYATVGRSVRSCQVSNLCRISCR
jgi:transposase